MEFEILEPLRDVEKIAVGVGIHDLAKLRRKYGKGRVGRKEFKIKYPLLD